MNGCAPPVATRRPFDVGERSPPAQREMILAFFEFIEEKLDVAGFFRPKSKRPVMQRNLRNMFHRMQLTQQDVRTLWGAMVRLVEGPRAEAPKRKPANPPKSRQAKAAGETHPPEGEG
jgi:tRNA/rRNA methyltransferase